MQVGVEPVVDVQLLVEVGILQFVGIHRGTRVRRVVPQLRILHQHVGDVDPEPVDAAIEPEAQYVEHRRPDRRIAPVQIRLLLEMGVQIELLGVLVPLPHRAADLADPVVRIQLSRSGVCPYVPVAHRALARRARLDEPRMLIGGVVRDVVGDEPDPATVCLDEQQVERSKISEDGIDVPVIRYVEALVE